MSVCVILSESMNKMVESKIDTICFYCIVLFTFFFFLFFQPWQFVLEFFSLYVL